MIKIKLIIFLVLNLNCYGMDYNKFEELLGQHISVAEAATGYTFHQTNNNSAYKFRYRHYSIESSQEDSALEIKDFYGVFYRFVFIQADENDIVQSITIYFHQSIDRHSFDRINSSYGVPSSIKVLKKRTVISDGFYSDNTLGEQRLRKSELELREGKFEEGPLFIIWDKEGYQIKATLGQKNIKDITYSLI